jgi:hypothetical protein
MVMQPHMGLFLLSVVALCLGTYLNMKETRENRLLKCPRCGSRKIRIKSGVMYCKKGHKVTVPVPEQGGN